MSIDTILRYVLLVILDYIYLDAITDYYALLGVAVDAPTSDIKAAFKKLALQYHPDVYKGDDAHERMRVLLQAYQTLNDPNAETMINVARAVLFMQPQAVLPIYRVQPDLFQEKLLQKFRRQPDETVNVIMTFP